MSNVKTFHKYFILAVLWLASMLFIFFLTKNYLLQDESSEIPTIDMGLLREAEIKIIHQELKRQSQDIVHLLEFASTMNEESIKKDTYSRILLPLMNIHYLMYTEYSVDISPDMETVRAFADGDITLFKIFSNKDLQQSIYGVKYFQKNFNKIVREVLSTKLLPEDTQYQHFVKKHIIPYVAYISPNGSSVSRSLTEAREFLELGDMTQFYSILKKIDSDSKIFQAYVTDLEKLLLVQNAVNEAKAYIKSVVIKTDADAGLKNSNS